LMEKLLGALRDPVWPLHLGRKSCPPSLPLQEGALEQHADLVAALSSKEWRPRLDTERLPSECRCVIECDPDHPQAESRPDLPLSFKPRRFAMRFVRETTVPVSVGTPRQEPARRFARSRQRYRGKHWKAMRNARSKQDDYRCVFCGVPSLPVHHVTYERSNEESIEDLRSLCRQCHDAITMLETERNMRKIRIDPLRPEYRDLVIRKRDEILKNRRQPPSQRRR